MPMLKPILIIVFSLIFLIFPGGILGPGLGQVSKNSKKAPNIHQ